MATNSQQSDKSIPQVLSELKDMTVSYAKQETVEPLRGLKRFVPYGLGAAVLLAIGTIELALGSLRLVQTEVDRGTRGDLSFVPYVAPLVVVGIVGYLAVRAISRKSPGERDRERR